jgi:hypothetical protein
MHLKVFLTLKKPKKLSLLGKYIKKSPKTQKKPLGWFFFKPGFFPTLPAAAAVAFACSAGCQAPSESGPPSCSHRAPAAAAAAFGDGAVAVVVAAAAAADDDVADAAAASPTDACCMGRPAAGSSDWRPPRSWGPPSAACGGRAATGGRCPAWRGQGARGLGSAVAAEGS